MSTGIYERRKFFKTQKIVTDTHSYMSVIYSRKCKWYKGSFCIVSFKLYLDFILLKITQLDKKMEDLKAEKHDLFSQLKKVLHQEDETRKKAQLKEQRYSFNVFYRESSCLLKKWNWKVNDFLPRTVSLEN